VQHLCRGQGQQKVHMVHIQSTVVPSLGVSATLMRCTFTCLAHVSAPSGCCWQSRRAGHDCATAAATHLPPVGEDPSGARPSSLFWMASTSSGGGFNSFWCGIVRLRVLITDDGW
jgi:hypothetical protein